MVQLLGSYIGLEHGAGEVHWAARLAEHYEGSTRAVLKVLGRGALVLVGSLMTLAGWMLTGIVWLGHPARGRRPDSRANPVGVVAPARANALPMIPSSGPPWPGASGLSA